MPGRKQVLALIYVNTVTLWKHIKYVLQIEKNFKNFFEKTLAKPFKLD